MKDLRRAFEFRRRVREYLDQVETFTKSSNLNISLVLVVGTPLVAGHVLGMLDRLEQALDPKISVLIGMIDSEGKFIPCHRI